MFPWENGIGIGGSGLGERVLLLGAAKLSMEKKLFAKKWGKQSPEWIS